MNQSALAHNTDEFIRYAVQEGRQDTPMQAFKNKLSPADINNITAFLRSKSMELVEEKPVLRALPEPKDYIVNKAGEDPNFDLKDDMYVLSKDLNEALNKKRMVLLYKRVTSLRQIAHIEGAIPFLYHADLDETVAGIPKDVQIVAYCSCSRAAADHTINRLRTRGYIHTAVLWEGFFG